MFEAVDAIALLRAVLLDECPSDDAALKHLAEAERRRMDPLDYASHLFGLGNELVWRRAAQWSGYGFAHALPSHPKLPLGEVGRFEHLGSARSLRQRVLGQDLTFVAPGFEHAIGLRRSWSTELHRRLRFAPPQAIETALACAASGQLMDYARQETTRLWPSASAALLPLRDRLRFAAILSIVVLLVMLSGTIARPFLIPVVAVLLMAPGLLRLAAALPGPEPSLAPPLGDTELPLYSVLIPLRDEAQMVPMLKRAMSAIDYPPHLLDIKFVVEAKSPETVAAVEQVLDDAAVPHGGCSPGRTAYQTQGDRLCPAPGAW